MAVCVGCGLAVDANGVLQVDLDGDPGSGIHCDNNNGLSLQIQHTDSTCIDLVGNGTSASPLQANIDLADVNSALACDGSGLRVVLSGDACNGMRFSNGGLYAPCTDSYSCIMNSGAEGGFVPFGINTGGAGNFNIHAGCVDNACANCVGSRWQVCNPSPCCTMEGFITFIMYAGAINGISVGFDAEVHMEIQVNGGGFGITIPPTFQRLQNLSGNRSHIDMANHIEKNYIILGPGECGPDFQIRATINVFAGTATWAVGPSFEYYIHTTQTNCGCAG